jgi:hypothetical protein
MNCESVRERITAEPAVTDPEFDRHAAGCPACRAYRQRLQRAESLITKALQFDVPAAEETHLAMPSGHARSTRRVAIFAGLAAGIVSAVTLWFWVDRHRVLTPEQLAREVTAHWDHEPESWAVTSTPVEGTHLASVLDGDAVIDPTRLGAITFAKRCRIAGQLIPHLVVQSDAGPVMVLLLPDRELISPVPLELRDEGLAGRIIPAGTGAIAVLGSDRAATERLEEIFGSTLEWTI